MPRVNATSCCGFYTITGFPPNSRVGVEQFYKDWLERFYKSQHYRDNNYLYGWGVDKRYTGKMYQLILGRHQWNKAIHKILEEGGFHLVNTWDNGATGSVCRAYQHVHEQVKR